MRVVDVRSSLRRLGVRASKRLGQHFLLDERVADRHVAAADIRGDDVVLEVGPGLGILTRRLASKARRVVAVERDKRLAAGLSGTLPGVEVFVADALKASLPPFNKVVSNLPYRISSPVTFRLLRHSFDLAVLMYQREFADRLTSGPGDRGYSRLSVKAYLRATVKRLETVPRAAFWPPPKVESAIVRIVPRERPFPVRDEALLDAVIDAAFTHRRKRLDNALRLESGRFDATAETLSESARSLSQASLRGEALRPEDFGGVADALYNQGIRAASPRKRPRRTAQGHGDRGPNH